MDIPESPHSRQEEYLAAIAGFSSDIPESPQSRQEAYLDCIIKNVAHVKTMPEPSSENEGRIVQYSGDTTESYVNGYFYKSVDDSGEYKWINILVQEPGGASSWSDLTDKPFETIGDNLKIVGRALTVDTASSVEQDNTKPITSAAVYAEVGNINALLALI